MPSTAKKILFYSSIGVLSILFLASAIGKQMSMDAFESTLNYYGFGLTSSSIFARLIITTEAFLAVLLWIPRYRKAAALLVFGLTLLFSVGLTWFSAVYPQAQDCGCHGQLLSLNPVEALVKNGIILLLSAFLILKSNITPNQKSRWMFWVMVITGIITLAGPPILSPPDFLLMDRQVLAEPIAFPNPEFVRSLPEYGANQRFILLFVSPSCKFCQFMTSRVYGLVQTGQITLPVHFVVLAEDESTIHELWEQTQVQPFPHTKVSDYDMFVAMSGQNLPSMFLMEGDTYRAHFAYRTMSLELIQEFQGKGN